MTHTPTELLTLRSATSVFAGMLRDAEQWAAVTARTSRQSDPGRAALLDTLTHELRVATDSSLPGTLRAIQDAVAGLLDGDQPTT
jgi:hypothetical protein